MIRVYNLARCNPRTRSATPASLASRCRFAYAASRRSELKNIISHAFQNLGRSLTRFAGVQVPPPRDSLH